MKNLLTLSLGLIMIVSCGQPGTSTDNNVAYDLVGVEFYNEFIPVSYTHLTLPTILLV